MAHMNQGSSSGSWQVAIPTTQSVQKMVISTNLQANPRPWVPLIRIQRRNAKGAMYLACRTDRHVAAGATM
eukprot:scaffold56259_cov64-Phaeocystis_antarctica.AAC.2